MTGRERILAAYRHKPVDRVPCSPRIWAWMIEHYGDCSPERYIQAADEFDFEPHYLVGPFDLPGTLRVKERYDLPNVDYRFEERQESGYRVVRRTFETPKGALTDETRIPPKGDPTYGISPNPIRTEYLIKSPDDLKRLHYLIPDKTRADFSEFHRVERIFGDRGLVSVGIYSQLCHRAGDVYPMEELMIAFYTDRAFFDELIGLCHEESMDEIRVCLKGGIRHFFANWYYNSLSAGWSPSIWREVFAPQLKEMCHVVHEAGGTVNLYDDGKCSALLETLADCGLDVLQTLTPPPVGDVDLADAKRRIGDRVCLMGHIDLLYVIQRGTPADIDKAVREAIEVAAPGGGFILGTSDSIRNGTPVENVHAYFDAAHRYCSTTAS